MRLLRFLFAVFSVFALVAGGMGRAPIAWACEGRTCSSDLLRCCCASVTDRQDGDCGKSELRSEVRGCEGGCGCQAVLSAPNGAVSITAKAIDVAPSLEDALLPETFFEIASSFVAFQTPQVRPIPPPAAKAKEVWRCYAGLRAPPAIPF